MKWRGKCRLDAGQMLLRCDKELAARAGARRLNSDWLKANRYERQKRCNVQAKAPAGMPALPHKTAGAHADVTNVRRDSELIRIDMSFVVVLKWIASDGGKVVG